MKDDFTHFNSEGRAKMVDVSEKLDTERVAIATGYIRMDEETVKQVLNGGLKKGDVLSVAQIGGIMGAKKTSDLIPMCHNIFLTGANIKFEIEKNGIKIIAKVKTTGKTGVEMEALMAVSMAGLTIYDMCKAIDKKMILEDIKLIEKTGGKSDFRL